MLLLFLGVASVSAQDRTIRGRVTDSYNEPIPGATVVLKGTTTGTVADVDGNFSIAVSGADPVLVISSTGFEKQEVTVGAESNINVQMKDSEALLTELVVTGYTVDTRRQTTGAVSTVKTRDLTAVPTGNVEQQLQGRVAGVTVITNGQPGTSSIVRVRGFGSFGGNEPLYVVDGVPTDNTEFLAPDDIETTTVLKDAAAASIYGARAAGGVIVFTTKKGNKSAQKLKVAYDGLVGFTTPGSAQELLTPQEQADWTWVALKNAGQATEHPQYGTGATPVIPDYINVGGASGVIGNVDLDAERAKYNVDPNAGPIYQVVRANKAGTDWYDAITRTAPMTRHSLGFTGSTESARYYVSLGVQEQAGILIHNQFRRYTFRSNTEFNLGKRVRVGQNLQFTYRQVLALSGDGGGRGVADDENQILSAFRMSPIIPVYDEFGGYAGTAAKGFNNPRNPVAERDGSQNDRGHGKAGFGNVYGELDLIDGLMFRTSFGGGFSDFFSRGYGRLQYENSENNSSFSYNESGGNFFNWVFTNTLNYKKTFGVSTIDVLAGVEALETGKGRVFSGSGINPFSTDIDYVSLSTVASRVVNSQAFNGVRFYSMFGRLNYSLYDKYYFSAVARRDGSSRFGANNRFGVFPAFSFAWRVTGERFMGGVSWIDDLKIRGGWGQMGNSNNVNPNNQFDLFGGNLDNSSYAISGSNSSAAEGFYKTRIGNEDAKWEANTTSNIGFDALLFNGKLDVILDFWRRETDKLLFAVPFPTVIGSYAASPAVNIASMLNEGIDLQIVNKGRFSSKSTYELTVTGGWLRNEIQELAPNVDYFDGDGGNYRLGSNPVRNQLGYSISSFFGYEVLGYFKDQAEVDAAPEQQGAAPGRFRFADLNGLDDEGKLTGRPDGKIDAADRTVIGSPVPKFTGGINFKVTLGAFDVETYLYTSLGNKIFNLSKWYTDFYPSFAGAAVSARVKESWTPDNLDAEAPIFENVSNFSTNVEANSWYVEDGSFLRMQNIAIGYNLPLSWFNNKVSRARIYASTNNVFTITGYKGLDPGVGGAVDTNFGIDIGNYPVTRSFMFGAGFTF